MNGWIQMTVRMPTVEDADEYGCVLVWHRYNGVMVLHVQNVQNFGGFITDWMPTPAAP